MKSNWIITMRKEVFFGIGKRLTDFHFLSSRFVEDLGQ